MDPAQTRDVICSSLGITDLYEAFQDINLEKPLGSATIAQVGHAPTCGSIPAQCALLANMWPGRQVCPTLTPACS